MILSTVLSLLVAANCYRLSRKENELLQKSCGVGNLVIQTVTTCSASLISPRHILTAAHCTKYLSYSNVTDECDGKLKNSVFLELKPEEFAAYVGTLCNPPERCNIAHSVSKVFVDKKWDRCALLKEDKFLPFTHDLAVLELSREVSSKDAIPICLPNRKLELAKELQAAGSGFENSTPIYDPKVKVNNVATIPFVKEDDREVLLAPGKATATCPGDSGGPLFQLNKKGRYVELGVTSGAVPGPYDCDTPAQWMVFADVRKSIDWICQTTGEENTPAVHFYAAEEKLPSAIDEPELTLITLPDISAG